MSTTAGTDILNETGELPRYDEYRDSGVEWLGEIPSHWNSIRLRFLLEVSPSKTEVRGLPEDTEVSFIPMEAVKENGGLDPGDTKKLGEVVDGYTYFQEGDVLVAKITPCFENRKGALASDLTNGIGFGTTEVHVLRPGSRLDKRFLYYSTMSHPFRKVGESTMYGAGGQKRVSDDFIENLRWPVPSLSEQRAIAAYLDREIERIDALLEKKEQLIDLLEEKRTALISRVVKRGLDGDVEMEDSGVEWLGEIPAGWDVARLKFLSGVQSGIAKGKKYDDEVETVELPYLRVANVQDGYLNLDEIATIEVAGDEVDRYLLQAGDVLMTEGGDFDKLGRGTVWTGEIEPCLHQNHIFAVRPRGVSSEWMALTTQAQYAKHFFIVQSVQSTNLASISMSSLQDLPVLLPPPSTREAILSHVGRETERIDRLIGKVQEAVDRLREYRTALISAAVTGKIDVRDEAESQEVKEAGTWERMVLVMELIRRMHAAQHESLGRTLLVKMIYLIQHHVRVTGIGFNYKRKDYGPYAPELRYEVESALQNQGWIQVSEGSEQVRYELREKADGDTVQSYFQGSWGDVDEQIDEIVSFFHNFDAERAEIVATLYAAWNDLKILDRPHDEDAIVREVRENWHPRKQKIDESRWQRALRWMKDEGLVPTGFGEPTLEE